MPVSDEARSNSFLVRRCCIPASRTQTLTAVIPGSRWRAPRNTMSRVQDTCVPRPLFISGPVRTRLPAFPARHRRCGTWEDAFMDDMARRAFIKSASIGALAFSVGGVEVLLTPRQARARVGLQGAEPRRGRDARSGRRHACDRRARGRHRPFRRPAAHQPAPLALLSVRVSEMPPPYVNFYRARSAPSCARRRQRKAGRLATSTRRRESGSSRR